MLREPPDEARSFGLSDCLPLVRAGEGLARSLRGLLDKQLSDRPDASAEPGSRNVSALAIIRSATLVLALFVLCDAIAAALGAPFPGAAVGMIILFAAFMLNGGPDAGSERTFDAIAPHISVFFIPAAAGIIANIDRFGESWLSILISVIAGTAVTLIVTGWIVQSLLDGEVGK